MGRNNGGGNPYHDPKTGQFISGAGLPVDYNNFYDNKFGVRSTTPKSDGSYEVESEDELIRLRREEAERERQIALYQEEAERLAREDKEKDEDKKKSSKPRRSAMKTQYKIGDTFSLDGKTYTVVGEVDLEGKFAGYVVHDGGSIVFLSKYGELKSDFPQKYRDL